MDIKICPCCGKEIILEDNEYEEIDGELYCSECIDEHFGKCEWCNEWVTHDVLAWYGNILCCDDCATHDWKRLEAAHGWR